MSDKKKQVLAFDFGGGSGRAILGTLENGKIHMEEVHRFSNDPVIVNGTMYWDTLRHFFEIKQGIVKAKQKGGFESIGIDTWGVDFGLLDEHGDLLESAVHYRDDRTLGMQEEVFKVIPKEEVYNLTGNQFENFNTIFQLYSLVQKRPWILEKADTLLLTPDLFNYFLTGEKKAEYTMATTTQLMDAKNKVWSDRILEALQIPKKILPEIVPSGTVVGTLQPSICEELGVEPAKVIAITGHDTQSAVVSVPTQEKDFIFISVKGRNIHSESWSRWHRKQNLSRALSIRMHRSSFRQEMYRSVFVSSAAEPDRKYRRRLVRSCAVSTRVWL